MKRPIVRDFVFVVAFAGFWTAGGPLLDWRWRWPTWVEFVWGLGVGIVTLGTVSLSERVFNRPAKPSP
jgi:hypothetical protein